MNQEILEKAIQKAITAGWVDEPMTNTKWELLPNETLLVDGQFHLAIKDIIYDHDFAKALWGEAEVHHYDLVDLDDGGKTTIINKPRWHYHLQQMVIADDPIKYLGENLPGGRG